MQRLEVSGAVRPIYGSLGVKRLTSDAYILSIHSLINPFIHSKENNGTGLYNQESPVHQSFIYSPTDAIVSCLKKTTLKFTLLHMYAATPPPY